MNFIFDNPVWYKRQFDSASGYNGNSARDLKNQIIMNKFRSLVTHLEDCVATLNEALLDGQIVLSQKETEAIKEAYQLCDKFCVCYEDIESRIQNPELY